MATETVGAESVQATLVKETEQQLSDIQVHLFKVRALAQGIEDANEHSTNETKDHRAWAQIDSFAQLISRLIDEMLDKADDIERNLDGLLRAGKATKL